MLPHCCTEMSGKIVPAERELPMTYYSILFNERPNYEEIQAAEMPEFFTDLNLDQVVNSITAGRQEYDLKPFFYYPIRTMDTVLYRQAVAKDLESDSVLESVQEFAYKMVVVRRYLALVGRLDYHYHKAGWFLETTLVYCGAIRDLERKLSPVELKSSGLIAFRDYLTAYVNSEEFQTFLEETAQRKADLATVRYAVIIKGNRVGVRKYEEEPDYSQEVEQTFAKFKQGAVKDYRVKSTKGSGFNHVEAQILIFVAKLYPEIFAALDAYCEKYQHFLDETIRVFDREIQFYVSYLEYIQRMKRTGLPFCYPEVTPDCKAILARDAFDIALANKLLAEDKTVVRNDFSLEGNERVIVVSGPNQGGKTTFARMFGQLHHLASIGLPVPGRQSRLFLYDRLFTHFEKQEDIKNLRGKLHDDLVRIHEILEQASPASIVIMNEIFTSTTLQDAVFLSKKVMERILDLDLLCVCVTFMDELSTLSEKTISMVSTIVPENPAERTFKIVRRPADGLAYAISIAEKYNLTYRLLKERIQG